MTDAVNLGVELSKPSRNWRRGAIRITLKSLEGLHRFFNDFRIDTRFFHQNHNFLITIPRHFRRPRSRRPTNFRCGTPSRPSEFCSGRVKAHWPSITPTACCPRNTSSAIPYRLMGRRIRDQDALVLVLALILVCALPALAGFFLPA
jgi:hypothetical protein